MKSKNDKEEEEDALPTKEVLTQIDDQTFDNKGLSVTLEQFALEDNNKNRENKDKEGGGGGEEARIDEAAGNQPLVASAAAQMISNDIIISNAQAEVLVAKAAAIGA